MRWEVFTIGGGTILVDIFNAVVVVMGTTAYEKMRLFVLIVAVAWVALARAFDFRQRETGKYLITFMVIWGALVVPTGTVKITDRLNPTLAPATIDNVPMGLGFFAAATSTVGDTLTRVMEATFSLPNNLEYQKHGMIFGARLMEAATRLKITDAAFAKSVENYTKQCVFPALFLGHLDWNTLRESTDIWATITASPSPARMFELRERDPNTGALTRNIVTCQVGAPRLTAAWTAEQNRATNIFSRRMFPNDLEAVARAQFLASLPQAHTYLIGAARGAMDIMRQQMTINAVHSAAHGWIGETGNAAAMNAYIQARAEVQTRGAYVATGMAAGRLIPTLKAVFEGLFYGFFPIAILLMMTPVGLSVFKSYFFGFVWLQSWGPLYAILNRMMLGQAQNRMEAISDMGASQGISMIAQSGIQVIESDIAATAGYLSSLLPFVALWLIRNGLQYAGSLATSYAMLGQHAASEAAREGTTGNISLGNTSQDVHSFAKSEGFKTQQSPSYDAARFSSVNEDGSQSVHAADGRASSFQGTAGSDLPTSIDFAATQSQQLRQSASDSRSFAENQLASAGESYGAAVTSGASLLNQVSQGVSQSEGYSKSLSADDREAFRALDQHVNNVSEKTGLDKQSSLQGMLGGHFGNDSKLFGGKLGLNASGQSVSSEAAEEVNNYLQQEDVSQDISRALSASQRVAAESSDSSLQSLGDNYSSNLSEARQFEERASVSLSEAQTYEKQADQVESQSAAVNQRLSGQFFDYTAQQPGLDGTPLGHAGASRLINSRNMGDQEAVRHLANDFVKENFAQSTLPTSSHLPGAFAAAHGDLKEQANIQNAHEQNLVDVREGGGALTGGTVEPLKTDVGNRIDSAGERVEQSRQQVEQNQAQREQIRDQAGKTALAGSGTLGEKAQSLVDNVSGFFGGTDQSGQSIGARGNDNITAQDSSLAGDLESRFNQETEDRLRETEGRLAEQQTQVQATQAGLETVQGQVHRATRENSTDQSEAEKKLDPQRARVAGRNRG